MKSYDFNEELRLFSNVRTLMKSCDFKKSFDFYESL